MLPSYIGSVVFLAMLSMLAGWPCLLCWLFDVDGYAIYAG